jgi:hypothetical protein
MAKALGIPNLNYDKESIDFRGSPSTKILHQSYINYFVFYLIYAWF